MDVTHLTMGEVKNSSFSVKDLLDLQESGMCHPLSQGLTTDRANLLQGSHLLQMSTQQQQAAPELGEIIASSHAHHGNHDARQDACLTNHPNSQTESPVVTTTPYYDQDNPYTRWLQNNDNVHYSAGFGHIQPSVSPQHHQTQQSGHHQQITSQAAIDSKCDVKPCDKPELDDLQSNKDEKDLEEMEEDDDDDEGSTQEGETPTKKKKVPTATLR